MPFGVPLVGWGRVREASAGAGGGEASAGAEGGREASAGAGGGREASFGKIPVDQNVKGKPEHIGSCKYRIDELYQPGLRAKYSLVRFLSTGTLCKPSLNLGGIKTIP